MSWKGGSTRLQASARRISHTARIRSARGAFTAMYCAQPRAWRTTFPLPICALDSNSRWTGPLGLGRGGAKEQRGEVDQVVAPNRPVVNAGRLDCRGLQRLCPEPGHEPAVGLDQIVLRAARDPEEPWRDLGVHAREHPVKLVVNDGRAEPAYPGEHVRVIEPDDEALPPAHREPRDRAILAPCRNPVSGLHLGHDLRQQSRTEEPKVAADIRLIVPLPESARHKAEVPVA